MKKRKMLGLFAMAMFMVFLMPQATVKAAPNADGSVDINEENFPDAIFREYVEKFDDDDDGVLSMEEQNAALMIVVTGKEVASLDGVEYFPKLQELYCDKNELTSLDVSKNTALTELYCDENNLTSLDVSGNTSLIELHCRANQLTSLDVSKNAALEKLLCDGNNLTSLDVSSNTSLIQLNCYDNNLTSLDVSRTTALERLLCDGNNLTSLDVSNNIALEDLYCRANQLTSLDVSNNIALEDLQCDDNELTSLDVSKNTALRVLYCEQNNLTSLDVSNNIALYDLICGDNELTSLDVSKNTALERLLCDGNNLTSLDVSNNTSLKTLWCGSNKLTSLNLQNNSISNLSLYLQELSLGEVPTTGFNIKDYDADIDVAKVTNVTGATYDAATGMFTGYAEGTPITYTYLSTDAAGTNHKLKVSLKFTVKEAPVTVAAPVADVPAGTYTANQKVTLSTATEGATIYYTTDGSEPTTASTVYTGAIEVSGMEGSTVVTNIKAIAGKDGMSNSPVASFVYTVKIPHTHSYSETYKSDADGHWKECDCGDKTEESGHNPGAAATETTAQTCTVCGYVIAPELGHQHSYNTTYSSDADNHWKACACGDKKDVAAHSFDWVIDKEASIAAAGSKHEECSVCDYAKAAVEIPQLKEEVETDKPVVDNTPVVDDNEDEDDDEDDEEETVAPAYAVSPKTGEVSNVWAFLLAMFALTTVILFCNAKKVNK